MAAGDRFLRDIRLQDFLTLMSLTIALFSSPHYVSLVLPSVGIVDVRFVSDVLRARSPLDVLYGFSSTLLKLIRRLGSAAQKVRVHLLWSPPLQSLFFSHPPFSPPPPFFDFLRDVLIESRTVLCCPGAARLCVGPLTFPRRGCCPRPVTYSGVAVFS